MPDRVTLLLLWLFDCIASFLEAIGLWLGWLAIRRSNALVEAIFGVEESESESTPPLWIDRWLRKASRLEVAARSRCSSGISPEGS